MGRSTTSCFKIISCGCINQSVDRDEIDVSSENKGRDKPGWSLRKRSPRHHVPSSTVVTENIHSSENKVISEPITITSEPQINPNVSEKASDNIWTEEIPNSITKNAAVSTMAIKPACEEDDIKCEPVQDESESELAVLVIQAAVRRFLAERRLVKHRNVVKLQAAVRGHLVRNHAVGTLRCVQAIVKMQALVRARREKGVQNAGINSSPTHISIEKLLSNRLARQLLESTPKTKQINIKCDPSKSDSAWNWLERWMSVSSPETVESHTPDHDQDKDVINTKNEVKTVIPSNSVGESTVRFEEKEDLINIEEYPNVETHEEEPKPIPENPVSETESEPIPENPVSEIEPGPIPENPVSETEPKPIHENPVSETELEQKHTSNQITNDQPDPEGKKNVFGIGSRKASNPAFIAAQSRFEELTSSKPNPLKSPNSSNQDDEPSSGSGSGSPADNGSSDPLISAKSSNQDDVAGSGSPADIGSSDRLKPDVEPGDYLVNHGSRVVQNGGSECGTELSITSALDSPDQYEEQVDEKPDDNGVEPEPESSHRVHKSNEPEPVVQLSVSESPRSHITTLESQGTPSSQVSTTTKKTKSDKKVSGQKPKSWSTSKKSSPVSSNVDSGLRSSLERLPKDPKPVKRRNYSGSPKSDHIDRETSVPSYMQATESARAKAVANSSPRSSPDVHDKETYLKKRHSLPGAVNGRQGSPRIQRSMSQALQTTKGNGNQERKWQR